MPDNDVYQEQSEYCLARCSHGGVCTLDRGHAGQHNAGGYCQFDDSERLSDQAGDDKYRAEHPVEALILGPWIDSPSDA